MGIPFAAGMEMLYDAHLRFTRAGFDCFLRINNFAPSGDYIEVGVPFSPTGAEEGQSGFVDILIEPPPSTVPAGSRDVGLFGGKVMFGDRKFFISHTFVLAMLEKYPTIQGAYNVFRRWDGTAYVQGLVYNNQLYSIEGLDRREIAGETINWIVGARGQEEYLQDGSQEVPQP